MKSGSFRSTQWDPILLVSQIISVQFCVYFTLGLLVFFANLMAGENYRLDNIFEYHVSFHLNNISNLLTNCHCILQEIHVSDLGGRLIICAFVTNSFVASLALWCIVRRAKLCLDFRYVISNFLCNYELVLQLFSVSYVFSCTFHIFHLLICWWYNNAFPSNISWWLLNATTTTIMCIGGEFLCLKSELKEIPVGYSALNQKSDV